MTRILSAQTARHAALAGATTGLFLAVSGAAFAMPTSIDFGPAGSTQDPLTSLDFNLSVPTLVDGDGSLTISVAGDLDSDGSNIELVDVLIDGTVVASGLGGGAICQTITQVVTVPESVLSAAAADGTVTVSVVPSPTTVGGVNAAFCGGIISFGAPFTALNGGSNFSVAAAGTLTLTEGTPAPEGPVTEEQIATFMANRASLILAHGPDHQDRVERLKTGGVSSRNALTFEGHTLSDASPIALDVTRDSLAFAHSAMAGNATAWAEGSFTRFSDDASEDGAFNVLHVGLDWAFGPDTVLGFGVQIDQSTQTDAATGAEFDGTGWMIGPVFTHRLRDDLYVDGRLAFGAADNELDESGAVSEFDSTRALLDVALIGGYSVGDYTFAPEVALSYYEETQDAFGTVAETKISIGQATIGTRISRGFATAAGSGLLYVDLSALSTHYEDTAPVAGSFAAETDGWSGSAALGAQFGSAGGWNFDGSLGVAGLGTDAEATTLGLELHTSF